MRQGSSVYYLHGDHLGSASLTTDASGAKYGELRYKPYGETRYVWGATPTDRRFTGQREEAALGSLYDYGARFYSPSLNRFISPDTIVPSPGSPADLNRYSYARNSPLKFTDPTGHYAFEEDPDDPWSYGTNVRSEHYYTHPNYRDSLSGDYWRTENGWWFDRAHSGTGKPKDIIGYVRKGGWFVVPGGVKWGFSFEVAYWAQPGLEGDQVYEVALGIYEDWARRFEAWEGDFPLYTGVGTANAMEDLPSHELGYLAAKEGIEPWEVIQKYLGGAEWTNQQPPRDVKNYQFTPLVQLADGRWVNVPWPKALTITPIGSESGLWQFVGEESYGPPILNPLFREWMRERGH